MNNFNTMNPRYKAGAAKHFGNMRKATQHFDNFNKLYTTQPIQAAPSERDKLLERLKREREQKYLQGPPIMPGMATGKGRYDQQANGYIKPRIISETNHTGGNTSYEYSRPNPKTHFKNGVPRRQHIMDMGRADEDRRKSDQEYKELSRSLSGGNGDKSRKAAEERLINDWRNSYSSPARQYGRSLHTSRAI